LASALYELSTSVEIFDAHSGQLPHESPLLERGETYVVRYNNNDGGPDHSTTTTP
jgi:hypothetical protein